MVGDRKPVIAGPVGHPRSPTNARMWNCIWSGPYRSATPTGHARRAAQPSVEAVRRFTRTHVPGAGIDVVVPDT